MSANTPRGKIPLVSVITPYADYHNSLVARAALSVAAQTIPCEHITIYDQDRKGPGWARNRGAERATAPFLAFLDADDTITPTFCEKMLRVWQPQHYVYCDFASKKGRIFRQNPHYPHGNSFAIHTNCCIISNEAFSYLQGYREDTLFEDTEFWFRAMAQGICGLHCPYPLVTYNEDDGQRNEPFYVDYFGEHGKVLQAMAGCNCGSETPKTQTPVGERQPGDILVLANWGYNTARQGRATKRKYPRTGHGKRLWVAPEDVQAQPNLYIPVEAPQEPPVETVNPTELHELIEELVR